MKSSGPGTESYRQLTIADTVSWLKANGWSALSEEGKGSFVRFTKSIEEGLAEIELPRHPDFRDFALRMAEVVDIAATVENRPQSEIVSDIRRAGVDTLRLRFEGGIASSGRVKAENGAGLFQGVRDLLLAGACATVERRPLFARRKPDQAMQFLQHVCFAPPELGSFTVVVESPVIPHLQGQASLFADDPEPPFERRAMKTLAQSVDAVIRASEQTSLSQELTPFLQAIELGVTANLCEALASVLRAMEGSVLEAKFAWSRNRPLPAISSKPLRVLPDSVPILDSVARELRAREPQPDFELRGPILELASEDPGQGGTLTIGGVLDSRVIRVRVFVQREVYGRALKAHEEKKVVFLEGELVREGRSFGLQNSRNFLVENEE